MLSFFRSLINSKVGIIVTFAALIIIALAFAAGDVSRLGSGGGGGLKPTSVAEVGGVNIGAADFKTRVQNEFQGYQQQQPTLDMAAFVNEGGFDGVLDRVISGLALEQFGAKQGMVVSKKSIDGQIASLPALQGLDGKFDPELYKRVLAERHMTDASVRADIAQGAIAQQLTDPTLGATQVPQQLATPYASLLLEKRSGMIGFIPTRAMGAGAKPTDQEIQAFYQHSIARYTVPERRVVRYAVITPDTVKAQATPTDAEIAQAYQAQQARFAATEKRTLKQVILADKNAAGALAKKVQGGTSIDAAAKAAGFEAATIPDAAKADYAKTSADAANAAFAAASGAVVGPVRTPLGWAVIRVEKVTQVPAKSLAEAHDILAKELAAEKTQAVLGKMHDALDDGISDNSTFDELIGDQKLTPTTTAPLLSNGSDPDHPTDKLDPSLGQIVLAAFQAEDGDSPQLVPVGQDGSFALVGLEKIVPAAPRPLAQIRDAVVRDFSIDRARRAARAVAADAVAKINKGSAIGAALSATNLKLPPVQPLKASRAQLAANPRGAPPPLALMFSMAEKKAKLLEAPNDAGWFVIYLDTIDRGNAAGNANVINATRADLGKVIGGEYTQQFAEAVKREVGVKKNAAAIADVRRGLLGQATDDQP